MDVYDKVFVVELKNDNSTITEADKKANHIINSFLLPTKIPIISEENKQTHYTIRKTLNTYWIVGPVDGTKEVVKRNSEFAVNIALVANNKPVLGVVVGSGSHINQETLDFVAILKAEGKEVEIASKGSSLKFCLVAEGRADIYLRFSPTMEWDTAAGQIICNAVGIEDISKETGSPLVYNKENLLNTIFLVGKS